ncbi:MAG TPA: SsrA-binding protein SmpB [Candidatus Levybacteria bacterium]|nr:SsrA-binding protein SmpB [Candidatus Levybacteria bacterium]
MKIINKQLNREYTIIEKLEAGIVLIGSEVKAIRGNHANLDGSHVRIVNGEAYLINAKVFPYKFSRTENYQETRTRKLLLHGKEITTLKSKLDQGNYTLVPTMLYLKNNQIKLEIALVKGKAQHEKRKELRKKAIDRDVERELKKWS